MTREPDDTRRARFLREMGIVEWRPRAPASLDTRAQHADLAAVPAVDARAHDERNTRIAALDPQALADAVAACTACGLCSTRKRVVVGVGPARAAWMLIGEAPGADEDAQGEPFVGQAGRLLDRMLAALALSRADDAFIANVLKCRPPQNRDPRPEEVAACRPFLERQIALARPRVLILLGRFAAQTLLSTDASVARLRGRVHEYAAGDRRIPVIVTYHPAYLLRTPTDKAQAWVDWNLALDTWNAAGP